MCGYSNKENDRSINYNVSDLLYLHGYFKLKHELQRAAYRNTYMGILLGKLELQEILSS